MYKCVYTISVNKNIVYNLHSFLETKTLTCLQVCIHLVHPLLRMHVE